MPDQHPPDKHSDSALGFVGKVFGLLHFTIAWLLVASAQIREPIAAIIYAVLSLGGIGLGFVLLKRRRLHFGWVWFIVFGLALTFGMLWLVESWQIIGR